MNYSEMIKEENIQKVCKYLASVSKITPRIEKQTVVKDKTPTKTVDYYIHTYTLSFIKSLDSEEFEKDYVLEIMTKVQENADCMLHNYINQRDVETMCREYYTSEFMNYINNNFVYIRPDGTILYYQAGSKVKTVTQFMRLYALSFALALDSEGVDKDIAYRIIKTASDCSKKLLSGETSKEELEEMCSNKYGIDFIGYVPKRPVFVKPDGTLVTGGRN